MLPRIFWDLDAAEREAQLFLLRDERERLEAALLTLAKEERELRGNHDSG